MQWIIGLTVLLGIIAARWLAMRIRIKRFHTLCEDGNAHIQRKDFHAAQKAFRNAVRLYPLSTEVRSALALTLTALDRHEDAEKELKLAADLKPRHPQGHLQLAYFYLHWGPGHETQAIDAFQKAIQLSPDLKHTLTQDQRLNPLQNHPRYQDLIE